MKVNDSLINTEGPIDSNRNDRGWICPVCGRGNAPWVGTCPCQFSTTHPVTNPRITWSDQDEGNFASDLMNGITYAGVGTDGEVL